MNLKSIFLLIFLLTGLFVKADKPVRVKATYTYRGNTNETTAEAERIAKERTKIKAIEEAFGVNVSETAAGITSTQYDDNFFSAYSSTTVKGEWIETIDEQITRSFDDRIPVITCTMEGFVKEIKGLRTDYEVEVLKHSPNEKFVSTDFQNGDQMYLYFNSPTAGYISVFLLCLDDDVALCLLPYRDSKIGSFRVEADKDYYFFSKDKSTVDPEMVDEYTLTTERSTEFNDVVIIFSPEEFNKVSLKVKEDDLTAIKETSIDKFNKWRAKLLTNNNNITLKTIPIKISSK